MCVCVCTCKGGGKIGNNVKYAILIYFHIIILLVSTYIRTTSYIQNVFGCNNKVIWQWKFIDKLFISLCVSMLHTCVEKKRYIWLICKNVVYLWWVLKSVFIIRFDDDDDRNNLTQHMYVCVYVQVFGKLGL